MSKPGADKQAGWARGHGSRILCLTAPSGPLWVDVDGMVVVRGRLTPEVGAVLRRALEAGCDEARRKPAAEGDGATAGDGDAAASADGAEEPTLAQRQADAIGMVAEAALAGGLDKGTAGDRYQVVLHVDAEALTEPRDVPAGTPAGAAAGPGQQNPGRWALAEMSAGVAGPGRETTNDRLAADGISIDARTATPAWDGERLDLHWVIGVLWRPRRTE